VPMQVELSAVSNYRSDTAFARDVTHLDDKPLAFSRIRFRSCLYVKWIIQKYMDNVLSEKEDLKIYKERRSLIFQVLNSVFAAPMGIHPYADAGLKTAKLILSIIDFAMTKSEDKKTAALDILVVLHKMLLESVFINDISDPLCRDSGGHILDLLTEIKLRYADHMKILRKCKPATTENSLQSWKLMLNTYVLVTSGKTFDADSIDVKSTPPEVITKLVSEAGDVFVGYGKLKETVEEFNRVKSEKDVTNADRDKNITEANKAKTAEDLLAEKNKQFIDDINKQSDLIDAQFKAKDNEAKLAKLAALSNSTATKT